MTGDIVFGIFIGLIIVLVMIILYDNLVKNLVRESIYNPEKFKVRQDEFTRNIKDRLP